MALFTWPKSQTQEARVDFLVLIVIVIVISNATTDQLNYLNILTGILNYNLEEFTRYLSSATLSNQTVTVNLRLCEEVICACR